MAIVAIIVVMLLMTVFAAFKYNFHDSFALSSTFHYAQNRVEATVKGAVVHSGVYSLPKEMSLKELLEIAELTDEGDVRRFNLQRTVQQGRAINIPKRPMITLRLSGAIRSGEEVLTVPQGTKVEELINRIVLNEDADVRVLKKKRKIKEGESIYIPSLRSKGGHLMGQNL
jgi:hypothetical protein